MLLDRLRNAERNPDEGFTLLEVLVVILIIGVLVAIATPLYRNQQVAANNANLQRDLRNAASAYMGWRAAGGTNMDFYDMAYGSRAIHVVGYNVQIAVNNPVIWNNISDTVMYPIAMTDNSSVEIVVNVRPGGTAWGERAHQEGEFCIVGTNIASNYDYIAGSSDDATDPARYERLLFFDGMLGRVVTIEELADYYQRGTQISCFGHAKAHAERMGL